MDKPVELLTVPQAAELLEVAPETVRAWIKEAKISHVVLPSGMPRIRRSEITRILTPKDPA